MANYPLQSHGGEGLYMTADGTPTARRNVYIKARVSDSLDQTWRIDSPSNGARTRIFSCKSNNTGGYALNNATGTNNCDIISHISERGGSPLCGDKPSAERTRPQGCISAPLVPKGFSACRSLCSFFQIFPRWFTRQGKPEKCCGFLVGHVLCFRHNAFKDRAPDNKAVVSLPAFLAGQLLPQNLFSVFVLLDFLLAVLNLGGQFLAGFLSRFRHGWSLLSVRRHRKRTVDLLGCPDGSIKFSWGYPLKELRSSAPLFISSWIMVAKSFFTLSLSVFAPAFSTYTVLSPNLKVA